MVQFVLVRGTQIRHETSMVAGDHDAAFSCRGVDGHVLCADALVFGRGAELGGEIVFAYAADVDG